MAQLVRVLERECPPGRVSSGVEQRQGWSRGYVAKLRKTGWNVSLLKLLQLVEGLEIPAGVFFGRVFDARTDPVGCLRAIERQAAEQPALEALAKATWKLEHSTPLIGSKVPPRKARLEDLTRSSRSDQRKRLRCTQKYQTLEFMQQYLAYLDRLRYERPKTAAWIAEAVATEIVELVVADQRERLELQCLALGVYASAKRLLGEFTPAARAIGLGLELARRHELEASRAALLLRGAYVLQDHCEYDLALELLQKAQIIYSDLALEHDVSKVLVDRGNMFVQKGSYRRAQLVFERALDTLPLTDEGMCRWRLAAYHGIAVASRHLGQLNKAEAYLQDAVASAGQQGGAVLGKLFWLQGMLAVDRREYAEAEPHLLEALRLFTTCDDPLDVVLVSLDLMRSLLAQGKRPAAISLAKQMASLIKQFKGNKLAEGALLQLVEGGLSGEVNEELLDHVAASLAKSVPNPNHAKLQVE